MPRQYSPEFRHRAVRLVDTMMETSDISEFEAIKSVASKLGVAQEWVRRWRRKAQVDAGEQPGTTSSEHAEIRRLKREVAELRRANEILKSASAFFAAELDRPATK
jgi:transposase